jgi:hypothetical protein
MIERFARRPNAERFRSQSTQFLGRMLGKQLFEASVCDLNHVDGENTLKISRRVVH